MSAHTIAAALAGFMLGGLTVSVAAQLEDDGGAHGGPAVELRAPDLGVDARVHALAG